MSECTRRGPAALRASALGAELRDLLDPIGDAYSDALAHGT